VSTVQGLITGMFACWNGLMSRVSKAVMKRGCGDQQIRLGKRVSTLASQFFHYPPLQEHIFCESEDASREIWPDEVVQPIRKTKTSGAVCCCLQAEADFGNDHIAKIQLARDRLCKNATTRLDGLGRANSERTFVSMRKPATDRHSNVRGGRIFG